MTTHHMPQVPHFPRPSLLAALLVALSITTFEARGQDRLKTMPGYEQYQAMAGKIPEARKTVDHILRLDPGFTIRKFMDRHPGRRAQPDFTRRLADALEASGVPH